MNARLLAAIGAGTLVIVGLGALVLTGGPDYKAIPTTPEEDLDAVGLEDRDADGLTDALEVYRFGTDPGKIDSDGDGMPDGFETANRLDPLDANDAADDPDGDGLTNLDESRAGAPADFNLTEGAWPAPTDPRSPDTDGDGLPDGWEVEYGLDPLVRNSPDADPDADGLTNAVEAAHFSDPLSADGDGDGLTDADEIRQFRTDPARLDTDGDGMPDGFEVQHGLDPLDPADANADPDADGLTNLDESRAGAPSDFDLERDGPWRRATNPYVLDTDGDGMADGFEVQHGLDPLDPADANADPDADGLTNLDESRAGAPRDYDILVDGLWPWPTDPFSADTDGDTLSDGDEVRGYPVTIAGEPRTARSSPLLVDTDGDGLEDVAERDRGTNATNRDTDFDSLADGLEVGLGLDPLDPDSDDDGVTDGAEFEYWSGRHASALAALAVGDESPLTQLRKLSPEHARLPAEDLAALLAPGGNVDFHKDDLPNVLDPDSDEDGLTDGEELRANDLLPPLAVPRPNTDPAARDTDGDDLLDRWEVDNTVTRLGNLTLDPTRLDSDMNGVADGDEDFDNDGIVPFSAALGGPGSPDAFTNREEQAWGTHPHRADTDGDGLRDGFEAAFSTLHGSLDDPPLDPTKVDTNGDGQPDGEEDHDDDGLALWDAVALRCGPRTPFSNLAEQEAGTDPFLVDTDADGMPDAYETFYGLDPLNPADAALDTDADGILVGDEVKLFTNLMEFQIGATAKDSAGVGCPTSPRDPDTDNGGLTDGFEVLGLGDSPLIAPDALGTDPDGDGLTNELEVQFGTSPSNPDTDGDGLLDGAEVFGTAKLCGNLVLADAAPAARIRGSDPNKLDTDGDGMPDPWEVCHATDPRVRQRLPGDADTLSDLDEYRWGRPATLPETVVWWGGLDPGEEDTDGDGVLDGRFPRADVDADNDGLHDWNGEDPHPFNDHNDTGTPDFHPFGEGKSKDPRIRERTRDFAAAGNVPDRTARAATRLTITQAPSVLELGQTLVVRGLLEVPGQPSGTVPAPNVPVLLGTTRAWDPTGVAAIAVTRADGTFELVATRAAARVDLPAGVELFGTRSPTAAGLSAVDAGGQGFVVWSVNTSATLPDTHVQYADWLATLPGGGTADVHALRSSVARFSASVETAVAAALDSPERARVGAPIALRGRLVDVLGSQVTIDTTVDVVAFDGHEREEQVAISATNGTFAAFFATTGLPVGTYAFAVTFTPDEDEGRFTGTTRRFLVTLYEEPQLSLQPLGRPEIAPGESVDVLGTLTTREGPVGGGLLNLTVDGNLALDTRTGTDGSFSFHLEMPDDVQPGTRLLAVQFGGSPESVLPRLRTVNASEAFVSPALRVLRATNLTLTAPENVRTDASDVAIGIHLEDERGLPITECTLRVAFEGIGERDVSCGPEGSATARFALPKAFEPATRTVIVSYPGASGLAPATVARDVTFRAPTILTLEDATGNASRPLVLAGELLLRTGGAAGGRTVAITLDGEALVTASTDDRGRFEVRVPAPSRLAPGVHSLTASHGGSALTLPADPATADLVFRYPTRVDLETTTLARGTNLLRGSLTGADGIGVPGKVVSLTLPWTELATVTLKQGTFERILTVPDAVPIGPARATVTFPGDTGHEAAQRSFQLRIVGPADLELNDVGLVAPGGSLQVSGRALDEAGAPVRDGLFTVRVGRLNATGEPNPDGTFNVLLKLPDELGPGAHDVAIALTGSRTVEDTDVRRTFIVARGTEIVMDFDKAALSTGHPFTLVARLTDDAGEPLPDRPVLVELAYGERTVEVATTTDAAGRAVLRVPFEEGLRVTAAFPGETGLTTALTTAAPVAPTITAAEAGIGLLLLGLVGLAALAALALYAWYRTRLARRVRHILHQALTSLMAGDEYSAVILLAYRRLEEIVGLVGVRVEPQETAREFRLRTLEKLEIPEQDLDALIGLFETTRYGGRLPSAGDRTTAIVSLRKIIQSIDDMVVRRGVPQ